MYRTIDIILPTDSSLISTIETYNDCCNDTMKKAYESKTRNKSLIHNLTYRKMRRKYPLLQSSMIECARDQSMEMLKQCDYETLPVKNNKSGIRYNGRTISVNLYKSMISISTTDGRKKYPFRIASYFDRYINWIVDAATLRYSNGKLILSLNLFKEDINKREPKRVIGIDRGLRNIAVLSNNKFINSNHLTAVKKRYEYNRSVLQQKGTRSAKRKLKRISGSEKRFVKDVNHQISKRIVNEPASVFAMEDLTNIRKNKKWKVFNKLLHGWSFFQLEQMIVYKADELGKHVVFVNPKNTSTTCCKCGHIDKHSRNLSRFKCISCGFEIDADLNAARNIASRGKSLLSRPQRRPMGKSHSDRPKGCQLANRSVDC